MTVLTTAELVASVVATVKEIFDRIGPPPGWRAEEVPQHADEPAVRGQSAAAGPQRGG